MTLATTVAVPVLRGPAATAKILAAIDLLSGGRLRRRARAWLICARLRARRRPVRGALEAAGRGGADAARGTGEPTTSRSRVRSTPPPVSRWPQRRCSVPALRSGSGAGDPAAGLRRVARLADGWLASGYNTTPELFARAWADVRAEVSARGRDGARFPNGIATMWCYVTEERARAEAVLGEVLAPMLNRPPEQLRAILPIGSAEECAQKLTAYARARRATRLPVAARGRARPAGALSRTRRAAARCREHVKLKLDDRKPPAWLPVRSGSPRFGATSSGRVDRARAVAAGGLAAGADGRTRRLGSCSAVS